MVLLTGSTACTNAGADYSCQATRSESSVGVSSGSGEGRSVYSGLEDFCISLDGFVNKLFTEVFLK